MKVTTMCEECFAELPLGSTEYVPDRGHLCAGCKTSPPLAHVPPPFAHPSRIAPAALALVAETDARYPYGMEACTR